MFQTEAGHECVMDDKLKMELITKVWDKENFVFSPPRKEWKLLAFPMVPALAINFSLEQAEKHRPQGEPIDWARYGLGKIPLPDEPGASVILRGRHLCGSRRLELPAGPAGALPEGPERISSPV